MSAKTLKSRNGLADHAENLTNAAQSIVADLKTEASTRLLEAKKQAGSRLADAQETASDSLDSLEEIIKEHPFAAVGFGVVAGLLLAAFARRK